MKSSELIKTIEQNTVQANRNLRAVRADISSLNDERMLKKQRSATLLAKMANLQVDNDPDEKVQAIMQTRRETESGIHQKIQALEVAIESELNSLERFEAQNSGLRARFEQECADSVAIVDLLRNFDVLKEKAEKSASDNLEIKGECEQKLAQYKAHDIFVYLHSREYGKETYAGRGLVKMLDRWLANQTNFLTNLAQFNMLQAMQHAAAQDSGFDAQIEDLRKQLQIEKDQISQRLGLSQAGERVRAQALSVKKKKEESKNLHAQLEQYAQKNDDQYAQARAVLEQKLSGMNLAQLKRLAKDSPGQADDDCVNELTKIEAALEVYEREINALLRKQERAQDDLARAKSLERRILVSDYTGSRYEYGSRLDLNGLLLGYMAGTITERVFENDLRSYRQTVPDEPVYSRGSSSSSGSYGSPSYGWAGSGSGSSSSSSSSSSSDYSTSSSFGGDSSSTSDSF